MDGNYVEYARFLNKYLDKLCLTKAQAGELFAKEAGISEEAAKDLIYRYCQGTRRPGRENASILAKVLGCSVEEALSGILATEAIPTLRTTFSVKGSNMRLAISKLKSVEETASPLTSTDEFNKDALDYCILYNNNQGVRYLIDNNYCRIENFFSELTHPCARKGNIKLSQLTDMAFVNRDLELLNTIYPLVNTFILVDQEEEPELYVTKVTPLEIKKVTQLFNTNFGGNPAIINFFFGNFKLNEMDFDKRNHSLIKNLPLMKLDSSNQLANLLANDLDDRNLFQFVFHANINNGIVLHDLVKNGVKFADLELKPDGKLFYKENDKSYWITTLLIVPESKKELLMRRKASEYFSYQMMMDLETYMSFIEDYQKNDDLVEKGLYPTQPELKKELAIQYFNELKKEDGDYNLKEDNDAYCAIFKKKGNEHSMFLDKRTYDLRIPMKENKDARLRIERMKDLNKE